MKAKYIRVSTTEQNTDRQGKSDYIDKCSGSVAFAERPKAKKLLRDIDKGLIDTVEVHSIDRLGRNTLDIMQTIQDITNKGVNVISKKEGISTLLPDGKVNPVSKMMVGILGTLAEFELERIKERQREGIEQAKKRGAYKGNGGKPKETTEQFLNKAKNALCMKKLNEGFSIRDAAKLSGVSKSTALKINKLRLLLKSINYVNR